MKINTQKIVQLHNTPACASYLIDNNVFVGDALFMPDYGTGRCDFPAGSAVDLYHSVHGRLYELPEDTKVYTGHDYLPNARNDFNLYPGVFRGLKKVKKISLSHYRGQRGLFNPQVIIDLIGNPIEIIESFNGNLFELPQGGLYPLFPNLIFLDFRGGLIYELPDFAFKNLSNLSTLMLRRARFDCSSKNIGPFSIYYESGAFTFKYCSNYDWESASKKPRCTFKRFVYSESDKHGSS